MQAVFNRIEKKYMLNQKQYDTLLKKLKNYMVPDEHGSSSISNIYFDTKDFDLIKRSIEKPIYKEKVRLRSYEIPSLDTNVFLEMKKKYKKVVNKRRIEIPLQDAYDYMQKEKLESQIEKEIAYTFHLYQLLPKMFIAYERLAFTGIEDCDFRITFDSNIRFRLTDLRLELGNSGSLILPESTYIMEVKANFSYPLWFTEILSTLRLYPISFSKYGSAYQKMKKEEIYV